MYGDPDAIRALARTLTDQGEAVRAEGRRLLALLGATRWSGLAAEAAHTTAHRRVDDLAACAVRHDDAADALVRHAAEVEHRLAVLARAEDALVGLVTDGLGRAGELLPELLPDRGVRAWPDLDPGALVAAVTRRLG